MKSNPNVSKQSKQHAFISFGGIRKRFPILNSRTAELEVPAFRISCFYWFCLRLACFGLIYGQRLLISSVVNSLTFKRLLQQPTWWLVAEEINYCFSLELSTDGTSLSFKTRYVGSGPEFLKFKIFFVKSFEKSFAVLTPQNGQTHSNNSSVSHLH